MQTITVASTNVVKITSPANFSSKTTTPFAPYLGLKDGTISERPALSLLNQIKLHVKYHTDCSKIQKKPVRQQIRMYLFKISIVLIQFCFSEIFGKSIRETKNGIDDKIKSDGKMCISSGRISCRPSNLSQIAWLPDFSAKSLDI